MSGDSPDGHKLSRSAATFGGCITVGFSTCFGALFGLLTRHVYIPIMVPLALGAMVGATVGLWAFISAVRGRVVVAILVLATWVVTLFAFHWVEYRVSFITAIQQELELDNVTAPLSQSDVQQAADSALRRSVGTDGFWGFMKLRARSGIRWRLSGETSTGYFAGLFAWFIDFLLGLVLALRVSLGVQRRRVLADASQ